MAERQGLLFSRSEIQARIIATKLRDEGFLIDQIVDDPSGWQAVFQGRHPAPGEFLVMDFDSDPLIAISLLDELHASPEWHQVPVFFVSRSISENEIERFLTKLHVGFIQIPAPKGRLATLINNYLDKCSRREDQSDLLENPLPAKVKAYHLLRGKPHFLDPETPLHEVRDFLIRKGATYVLTNYNGELSIHTMRDHLRALNQTTDTGRPLRNYLNQHFLSLQHDVDWTIAFTTFAGSDARHLILTNGTEVVGVIEPECFHKVVMRRIFLSEFR
ncbi:hypothetical protein [Acanthopleuribacter pedis]|uniref:Response regulatory domain-containing protein n=1 Tax=Acanthopleuribacter pedis TaxID=442870 RepID=A0A8J7Q9M3_9BACT|nr:hypothetical protein [Acanthopleuribacter pedis]MBO1321211.1 hypothetical protein [Acanthopleuribacter pedis]